MTSYFFSIFMVLTFMKSAKSVLQSGSFTYKGNVSYSDVSLLISEQESDDTSLRYCAAECYIDLDCNAIELCSLPTGNVCRLSKSISTNFVTGAGSCSRHELVRNTAYSYKYMYLHICLLTSWLWYLKTITQLFSFLSAVNKSSYIGGVFL